MSTRRSRNCQPCHDCATASASLPKPGISAEATHGRGLLRSLRYGGPASREPGGGSNMADFDFSLTRRSALFAAVASLVQTGTHLARQEEEVPVHTDPTF